jgi:type I restriction enzyme S subunit
MVTLTKLGDIINTVKGYAFKSSWFTSQGVPIVKVKDFTEDSISAKSLTYISESIASQFTKYSLQENDIIIQTVGSWEHNPNSVVGKVVQTPYEL